MRDHLTNSGLVHLLYEGAALDSKRSCTSRYKGFVGGGIRVKPKDENRGERAFSANSSPWEAASGKGDRGRAFPPSN